MDYTYQFEAHLREHRPSRLGQRLWWLPAAVGLGVVIADGIYLAATPSENLSAALAVPLLFIAALLFMAAWAVLSIADWTYPLEKHYREAHHAAACRARAYILAGRGSQGERATGPVTTAARGTEAALIPGRTRGGPNSRPPVHAASPRLGRSGPRTPEDQSDRTNGEISTRSRATASMQRLNG